jgi:hypothetical protein
MPISLATALADGATKHALRAVDFFVAGELADFYLAAGIAIELAMKARLARENPTFLAPDRGFKHAVALAQTHDDVNKLPPGTKTVGAAEAIARVSELEPAFKRHEDAVREILSYRNGEAHVAAHGATNHQAVLASFFKAVNELLRVAPAAFWGDRADFVTTTLDETMAQVTRTVNEKKAAAQLVYRRRSDPMTLDQKTALLTYIQQERDRQTSDDVLAWECPVCESDAALFSGENVLDYDVDYDRDGDPDVHAYLEFHGNFLECGARGLELDGQDEVEEAGIEAVFINHDADVHAYMEAEYGDDR